MNTDHAQTLAAWLRPLPHRHRIAHLRALLGEPALGRTRHGELAALLRAELAGENEEDSESEGDRVA